MCFYHSKFQGEIGCARIVGLLVQRELKGVRYAAPHDWQAARASLFACKHARWVCAACRVTGSMSGFSSNRGRGRSVVMFGESNTLQRLKMISRSVCAKH